LPSGRAWSSGTAKRRSVSTVPGWRKLITV
jgi:hypothetical protein